MKKAKDEYRIGKIIEFDNAIVRVYYPIISDEEHERRMKIIHDAAAELLKDKMKNEKRRG